MAGLTEAGLDPKRFADILESVRARLRAKFGSGVETNEDSDIMQSINVMALEVEECWQGLGKVYDMFSPNNAEGITLDNLGAITATPRVRGANSTVEVEAEGSEGSTIDLGFQRAVETTGEIFATTEAYVLPASGSQPLVITMTALNDGPVYCKSGTLNQGALPSGVTSMTNPDDAVLGTYDETDEEYKIGRKTRLAAIANATVLAIKAALLNSELIPGVTGAIVEENDTGETVGSLPPHCIRALMSGGDDQDIWDVLGTKKGAGTYTFGTEVGTFTDPDDGQEFTMRFSRIAQIEIWVAVDIVSKTDDYPVTGDQDIEDNILALIWAGGEDVTYPKLQNAVTDVPGITDYTLYFGLSDPPVASTPITIDTDEIAVFSSSRITVTS